MQNVREAGDSEFSSHPQFKVRRKVRRAASFAAHGSALSWSVASFVGEKFENLGYLFVVADFVEGAPGGGDEHAPFGRELDFLGIVAEMRFGVSIESTQETA